MISFAFLIFIFAETQARKKCLFCFLHVFSNPSSPVATVNEKDYFIN